ncbi:extracellular solute-binding protein [Halosegnis marinus]|uniref:Extracellular solute-binding protein n=1 Tax=Halosegnis marinus TaxID=3034023 RepID=A0ABD5ZS58_9EURY|nr:extracellular solute-binding protein [Halosegnis sp. DT85]
MNDSSASRRRYLAGLGTAVTAGLAGCGSLLGGDGTPTGTDTGDEEDPDVGQIGSGREGREAPGGTPIAELPDLSGELDVYSGRGEALVGPLFSELEDIYPDFSVRPRYDGSTDLVNRILTEGSNAAADVFYSVNAGALGALAAEGRTLELPERVTSVVPDAYQDAEGRWIGTSGRARTIPYNTDRYDESDIPTDVLAFPDDADLAGSTGWAPVYGSFQAFVTAMRVLNDRETTLSWLNGMQDAGVQQYGDEFAIAQAIADGELGAGFANHYYTLRVLDARPDAPLDIAFTEGDAGAIFNVAGASVVDTAGEDRELAENFVRHLLSAEAQEYFATTTFEYPMIPGVEPVQPGSIDLPTIDQLNPPEGLDLSQLADLGPTLEVMREAGLNV